MTIDKLTHNYRNTNTRNKIATELCTNVIFVALYEIARLIKLKFIYSSFICDYLCPECEKTYEFYIISINVVDHVSINAPKSQV